MRACMGDCGAGIRMKDRDREMRETEDKSSTNVRGHALMPEEWYRTTVK